MAANKRGSHLSLSVERLCRLAEGPVTRIGLSATQKPIEEVARFLTGGVSECAIVDTGHRQAMDLAVELPEGFEMGPIATHEQWAQTLDQITELVRAHHTDALVREHRVAWSSALPTSCRSGSAARRSSRTTAACRRRRGTTTRAAAESRRRSGLRRHGVARAWHRRRRRRPRLPDRLAAQHRRRPPTRGPVGALAWRNAEGPLLPAHARRYGRDGRIAPRHPRGRARRAQHPALALGRVGSADGRRLCKRGVVRGRPLRHSAPGLSLRRAAAGEVRPGLWACCRRASPTAGAGAPPISTATA